LKGGKYAGLFGMVRARAEGVHPEEFMNGAAKLGVRVWDVRAAGKETLFSTDRAGLKRLEQLQPRGFSLTVLAEKGLIYLLRRLLGRKFLLAGFFCFCLALFYLSGLVWAIEIDGLQELDRAQFTEHIRGLGLERWGMARKLDFNEIEEDLYLRFPQIAWVAIERKGTKITVRVVEKAPNPFPSGAVIDIVAKYDGIISEMMVLKGIPQVTPGTTVARGDVLIAGYIEDGAEVSAAGSVLGRVFITGQGEGALREALKTFTGQEKEVDILELWGKKFALSRTPPYANYEVKEETIGLYRDKVFFHRRYFREVLLNTVDYTPQEAEELARRRALLAAHGQVDEEAQILHREEEMRFVEGRYFCRVLLTAETSMVEEQVNNRGE
jgi:similar to stage IV sporulation protein